MRIDKIQEIISKGNIIEAIQQLELILPQIPIDKRKSIQREVIQLKSQFNQIKKDRRLGIIDDNAYQIQINKVTNSILELLEQINSPIEENHQRERKDIWKYVIVILGISFVVGFIFFNIKSFNKNRNTNNETFELFTISNGIRISKDNFLKLNEDIEYVSKIVESEIPNMGKEAGGPWGSSQIVKSLQDTIGHNDIKFYQNYVDNYMDTLCYCWRETNTPPGNYSHFGATGWVLIGYSSANLEINENTIEYVLNEQSQDGGWPMHPDLSNKKEKYNSVYATSFILLGLDKIKIFFPKKEKEINNAIVNGFQWLINSKLQNKALWKDYPKHEEGVQSKAISAIAMHTINSIDVSSSDLKEINSQWILNLSKHMSNSIDLNSGAEAWYKDMEGELIKKDWTSYFYLPWMIIATVDSFKDLDKMERIKAENWLNYQLEELKLSESKNMKKPWFKSLMLISLKYLRNNQKMEI